MIAKKDERKNPGRLIAVIVMELTLRSKK